ncbi:MAG: hypothetical protein A3F12_07995 [Gammaproteobacteria bacterium RIFCSPHIGHO2_12_FULL_38_14]|nr:MAG: hypothetical protein A3F12_07995 [Gammaproteobacteria bacterium RIFCSPHIGHO2_12_FULL_38_14]
MNLSSNNPYSWAIDFAFLTLVLGALLFIALGHRPLFVPDEGRYAEIAREMVATHDYIIPHLNGIQYFEKPILFYWMTALAIKLFGLNIWSVRSVNACLAWLGILWTYFTARQLYDRKTGLLSAFIMGTSLLYFVMARMVSLDLSVTVFLSISLYAILLNRQNPKQHYYLWIASISSAAAVLTKGLIGIVFPILIVSIWLMISKSPGIKRSQLLICSFIFLVITLPWHLLAAIKHHEFFYYYFIYQQFLRYTTPGIGHLQPNWFFIPIILIGFLPWSIFLLQTLIHHFHRKQPVDIFFLLWIGIVFVFFSFSKSKLIPYILPIFPPLAILTAHYLTSKNVLGKKNTILLSLLSILLCLSTTFYFLPHLDTRTILPLATQLKPLLQSEDEVISYNQYYQDLPFYLERRITVLNWHGELDFGTHYQDTKKWMINNQDFLNRLNSNRHLYILINKNDYQQLVKNYPKNKFYTLGKAYKNLLVSNQPL